MLPVPRLKSDFNALKSLTHAIAPPKVIRRRKRRGTVLYGFGDASGKGFGHGIEVDGILYLTFGQWSYILEDKHSNYKELRNLVNAVEKAYNEGLLNDCELFLFTDNFVAECAYYNGGSNKNKDLDELVFRLWRMQMHGDFTLHVYHVAGTRMIECGVDGLSRGDKAEGITQGRSILEYIPIHLSPIERSPMVLDWVKSWWDDELGSLKLMSPEDWFTQVMKRGNFLWNVAPAAGEAAVEQLSTHIHGRPDTTHIFLIPRLCTSHYRKQLLKACDAVLTINVTNPFWDSHMHEPLLLGLRLPLLPPEFRFRPWHLKHSKLVDELKSQVCRVQSTNQPVDWDFLCKFLLCVRSIPSMSDGMVQKLLQGKDER